MLRKASPGFALLGKPFHEILEQIDRVSASISGQLPESQLRHRRGECGVRVGVTNIEEEDGIHGVKPKILGVLSLHENSFVCPPAFRNFPQCGSLKSGARFVVHLLGESPLVRKILGSFFGAPEAECPQCGTAWPRFSGLSSVWHIPQAA